MILAELPGAQLPVAALRIARTAFTAAATPRAWSTVLNLPGHRLFIVATPPGQPLMLSRIHLNGSVHTKLSKEWWLRASKAEIEAVAAEHHRKVAAGLAGWPTIIAALQLTSWGGRVWLAASSLKEAATVVLRLLEGALPGWDQWTWHLWGALVPITLAPGVRFAMRAWFRFKLNAAEE